VRRLAAPRLGRLRVEAAGPVLVRLLDDRETAVRLAALAALDALGSPRSWVERPLTDADPRVRLAAMRVAERHAPGTLAGHLDRLRGDAAPEVRAEAAVALAERDGEAALAILHALLKDADPAARAAALGGLARLGEDAGHSIDALGHDPSATVRRAAVEALGLSHGTTGPSDAAVVALIGALDDEVAAVRDAAGDVLRGHPRARQRLIEVLENGSGRAQEGAARALAGHVPDGHDAIRAWASGLLQRATLLHIRAMALAGTDGVGPVQKGRSAATAENGVASLLASVIASRRREVEARLLIAVGSLGAEHATGPIRRALGSSDPGSRAQAIEAIDAIGDPSLARGFVRLLDADITGPDKDRSVALDGLASDADPWIRGLALRWRLERSPADREGTIARAAADPDPVVRMAAPIPSPQGGTRMPATQSTLGDVERMLFLHRVPLFSQLSPEDLQRIAAAATERFYPTGEALVTEGEPGDELIVIAEGRVRVVQGSGEAARPIRWYETGDHIGELAVLTARPRVATVIAEGDVRGLVLQGESIRAILQERPDAAMAMLATLAERIASTS
jgi:HEAT repeat protein